MRRAPCGLGISPSIKCEGSARIRVKFPLRGNFVEFDFRTTDKITQNVCHYGFGNIYRPIKTLDYWEEDKV